MMQIALPLLALLVTPALLRGEIIYNSRLLLATEDDVFDEGDTSEANTVYQQVSSTTGATYFISSSGGWEVSNITGSIELDTAATYANNLVLTRPGTWEPGTSRLNVTVLLTQSGTGTPGAAPPTVSANLATVVCGTSNLATSLLANNTSGDTTATVASALGLNVTGSGDDVSNSTIYNFLVDYDLAKSIVVYGDGVLMACKNMLPPFPDFPNDWSATIENTDVDRGVTYTYQELYSTTFNMLRLDLHSYATDRILLSDPNNGQTTIIVPSNGSCQGRSFGGRGTNWITADDNTTLLSTAEMLRFTQADEVEYQPGFVSVRGIPCEVWVSYVDINSDRFNASFQVNYYFPVNEWLVSREDYHRMLKRVYLNGTRNGQPFESYSEYVNFRPRTVYGAMFDVCAISPYGQGCNCTNARRAAAFANVTQALSADGNGFLVPGDVAAACSVPHGFISAQSGPYVALTIIGMIGGSLITGLCMYFYYRKRVGVRISDNLGHTKFTDAPGT